MQKSILLKALILSSLIAGQSATAGEITDISFVSNFGNFINDTIDGNRTSPLGITLAGATDNPFLNNADSTVSIGFGDYFAIAFQGFGQHLGDGVVSFLLDGALFTQNVVFPDNSSGGVSFATFNLSDGDTVQLTTTGLSADRIRIAADGSGLEGLGTAADAFYRFSYIDGTPNNNVPEPASLSIAAIGLAALALGRRTQRRKGKATAFLGALS
jgi:PEP-CTERM motif